MSQALTLLQTLLQPFNIKLLHTIQEREGKNYNAYHFVINNKKIIFRTGKSTPTKQGHFVTLWTRSKMGQTTPYSIDDAFDFVILFLQAKNSMGYFIFSKKALLDHKIISSRHQQGKRGFRLYAPWEILTSKQARQTQSWQSTYFYTIPKDIQKIVLLLTKKLAS